MSYGTLIPELGSHKRSHYGFVNETAIRVGAGIMMTIGLITFLSVYFAENYTFALIVVSLFWLDFFAQSAQSKVFSYWTASSSSRTP
jgi:hypothetical protein